MSLKTIRVTIILIALFVLVGGIGYRFGQNDYRLHVTQKAPYMTITHKDPSVLTNVDFGLFWDVWNKLQRLYLDKTLIDPQKMVYGAISGMVSSVGDPYTVFLTPDQNKDTKEELGGSFEGIGAQLGFKDKQIIVIAPLKGTPAERQGIRPGDAILKIDGKDTIGMTLPEAVSKIRGPKGTKVTLTILHEKVEKPIDISLSRDTILVKSVEWEKKVVNGKEVALIKLSRFGDTTNTEWDTVVSEIKTNKISNIVLDVRNNPGGYLNSAIHIGSEFFKDGSIVVQESGTGEKQQYPATGKGKFLTEKVVVLINKGSASASEIVAGVIQDRKRGVLIGETSFGKGTVQEALDLDENAGLHITTAKWLLPSGAWIHQKGLIPDTKVEMDDKDPVKDPQLDQALNLAVK